MELTEKQQRFVAHYLISLNATQAATLAGYSQATADRQGSRLLSHPGVVAEIDAAKMKRSAELEIDAAWMLKRLVDEAEADLADLYDDHGDVKPVKDWPLIWRQGLVAGVEVEALFEGFGEDRQQIGFVKKIKISDRVRRLELIGKHVSVNAFQEQVSVSGVEALADRIVRAKERASDRARIIESTPRPTGVVEPAPRAFAPMPKPAPKAELPPEPKPKSIHRPIVPAQAPWPSRFEPATTDYDPLRSDD